MTFLSLLNPVVAAVLGWMVLDQRLNGWQILGAVIVLVSVVLGQPPVADSAAVDPHRRISRERTEPRPRDRRWPRSVYGVGTSPIPVSPSPTNGRSWPGSAPASASSPPAWPSPPWPGCSEQLGSRSGSPRSC